MHVGDHGTERELPFEAEPQIDQNAEDRQHQADGAVGQKLAGDARPHHLDPAVGHLVAERAAHLVDRRLLGLVAARLLGDADEHVVGRAELLQLHFAEAERAERCPHLGEIGLRRLALHLHEQAALEVDAEIEPVEEIERDRHNRHQRGNRKADAPEAHEVEFGIVGNDAQQPQRLFLLAHDLIRKPVPTFRDHALS